MTCLMRRYKAFVAVNVTLNCFPNITTYRYTGILTTATPYNLVIISLGADF